MNFYRKKRNKVIPVVTMGAMVLLIFLTSRFPSFSGVLRNGFNTAMLPVNKLAYTAGSAIQGVTERTFGSRLLRERNDQLTIENNLLKEKVNQLETVVANEEYLKQEFALLSKTTYKMVQASITSKEPGNQFVRFSLDRGSASGIKVGDTVTVGAQYDEGTAIEAVVGRVTEVGDYWASVVSIIDERSNLSFVNATTHEYGVVDGKNGSNLTGYAFNPKADINAGDKILTSGLGELYPKGLYIGAATSTEMTEDELTKRIIIKSPVDFSKLSRVLVLIGEETSGE